MSLLSSRPRVHEVDYRLYSDGGTIASPMLDEHGQPILNAIGAPRYHVNPSLVGVVWAWVLVSADDQHEIRRDSGYLLCPIEEDGKVWAAQSDLAEFFGGLVGFESLPRSGLRLEYLTDNQLTIRRMFEGFPTNSIPMSWVRRAAQRRRECRRIIPTHLNGHPTKEHLASGRGHSNGHVSVWNEVADLMCRTVKTNAWGAYHALAARQADAQATLAYPDRLSEDEGDAPDDTDYAAAG